jgi:hypothetical protein
MAREEIEKMEAALERAVGLWGGWCHELSVSPGKTLV